MSDDSIVHRPNPRPVLVYPCGDAPESGEAREVAPGVRWLRMPMPFALDHINLWAVRDGTGWAIVDTGLKAGTTEQVWAQLLGPGGALSDGALTRVLVTHMHPDHVGMAGWLTRHSGCALWMTRQEYLSSRLLMADTGRAPPEEGVAFYRRAGWDEPALADYRARFGSFGALLYPLPQSYRRLQDGEELRLGTGAWRVVVGRGHSPEHACFHNADLKLLMSGDQVLPRISSNVSVFPTEPEADPLADWLASLETLAREIPDDVLVLPAHNEPFRGLHARLRYLSLSQQHALERLRRALRRPMRAVDVFGTLFARPIDATSGLLGLATGESIAHLNHLMHRGEVSRQADEHGVDWYRSA